MITILFDVARTLARQGIAFRGDGDDKDGYFQQITHLVSRHNPALKNWLQSKDAKPFDTTSGKSQNEFIQLLTDVGREDIATEVSHSEMFTVMADTTPDVSVCYLDADDKPTERLVQVKEVTEKTGEGLVNEILTSLAECKIDKEMMRFQTFDSAANMSGNGAQKKLSGKVKSEITYILCVAHGANLVNEHSSKVSLLISSMYDILEAIYVFFNASTKRCKVLTDLL